MTNLLGKKHCSCWWYTHFEKGFSSKYGLDKFSPKTFEFEIRFMRESFLRFLRVGVRSDRECCGLRSGWYPLSPHWTWMDSTLLWKYCQTVFVFVGLRNFAYKPALRWEKKKRKKESVTVPSSLIRVLGRRITWDYYHTNKGSYLMTKWEITDYYKHVHLPIEGNTNKRSLGIKLQSSAVLKVPRVSSSTNP